MKNFAVFALASAVVLPAAASAQEAPAPTAQAGAQASATVTTGATVYDTSGATVGTVESTDGTNAVVNTGTVKAAIPLTSLGKGTNGPVLAMTKAQLEAAASQQQAQAAASFKSQLVPGAAVFGAAGTQIGTIKTVDASGVTVTTTAGDAKLPTAGFGPGPKGVTLGMTEAQLKAAMGTASPAGAASTTSSPTASATPMGATASTDTATASDSTATESATTATTTSAKKRKPK
ncbi:hypothetical protein [Sphingomonas sp.]|uniref:hypothetical protein n=1 Tax=Sphingomonas sp. TaxID=28214 RepID=UPI0035C81132